MSTQAFQDIQVHSPGFGAMSLAGSYGPSDPEEAQKVLKRALDLGCTFWDTALVYGMGANEQAIGRFFRENPGSREKVFLASKCGWDVSPALCFLHHSTAASLARWMVGPRSGIRIYRNKARSVARDHSGAAPGRTSC